MIASPDELRNRIIPCQVNPSSTNGSGSSTGKTSGTQGSDNSYESVAWFNEALKNAAGGSSATGDDAERYIEQGTRLLKMVLSYLGKQKEAAARQDANKANANISNLQNEQADIQNDVNTTIEEINSQIESNQELINSLVQTLQDTQAKIQEENDKKEELTKNIADAQKKYADETDPEKKEEILEELSGYNDELTGIIASLTQKVEETDSTSSEIEGVQAANDPLEGQIHTVESNGNEKVKELDQKIKDQNLDTNEKKVLAGVDEGVSKTAGTLKSSFDNAANAARSNVFSAPAAEGLQQTGNQCGEVETDTDRSSKVYFEFATQAFSNLSNLVGVNTNISNTISGFVPTAIGGTNEVNTSIDLAFNFANPIIESLGSIQKAGETTDGLSKAIETEKSRLKNENPEGEGDGSGDSSNPSLIDFDLSPLEENLFE